MPNINPSILKWARESAGLSLDDAAKGILLNSTQSASAAQRLEEIEQGRAPITRSLLTRMAKRYRRPLVTFYLAEPPMKGTRGEDYRTLPASAAPEIDGALDALLRDVRARQMMVRELREEEDFPSLNFIGSVSPTNRIKDVARAIIADTGFELDRFRSLSTANDAFAYLRACMEDIGIFVLLLGNLGSHHSNIPVEVFRGFAIADDLAPFVVINDQDAKSAWSFTLLHEACHLWLGLTGYNSKFDDSKIEVFCNDVASEILLPAAELENFEFSNSLPFPKQRELLRDYSYSINVSAALLAYRLYRRGRLTKVQWRNLATRNQPLKSAGSATRKPGGPSYYVVKRHRVGKPLLQLVQRGLQDGSITPTKAGKVLGVKARNVAPLLAQDNSRPLAS